MNAWNQCQLFQGAAPEDIEKIIIGEKTYDKETTIVSQGEKIKQIGVLKEGNLVIVREDYEGNRVIISQIKPGEFFGEAFVCSGETLTVSVVAKEKSKVVYISYETILRQGGVLTGNLLTVFSRKNVFLTKRIRHLSARNLSEKIMSYLDECAKEAGSKSFSIGMNRQEMADYLAADRSALSYVLSQLKKQGLIDYWKNEFRIMK